MAGWTLREVLNHYIEDLRYWQSSGIETWNHNTSGTPPCGTHEEMEKYITQVRALRNSLANPLTFEEALDALDAALTQCKEYSDNDWVIDRRSQGYCIAEMQERIRDTGQQLGENDND